MSLAYDEDHRFRCKLLLDSGLPIFLESLYQWTTYAALREGIPWREFNDQRIQRGRRIARRQCRWDARRYRLEALEPHRIPPIRRPYMRSPGDMDGLELRYPVPGVAEWLPWVTCAGVFKSLSLTRPRPEGPWGWSLLAVVWYQDEFAPPIDEVIVADLRRLDWERLAIDVRM
jgi:hypothetical protein